MKKRKLKKSKCRQWCYFAPDGWALVRTIADTREDSRKYLELYDKGLGCHTYQQYESEGYSCHKVIFSLIPQIK